jgi:hypothetical protein
LPSQAKPYRLAQAKFSHNREIKKQKPAPLSIVVSHRAHTNRA